RIFVIHGRLRQGVVNDPVDPVAVGQERGDDRVADPVVVLPRGQGGEHLDGTGRVGQRGGAEEVQGLEGRGQADRRGRGRRRERSRQADRRGRVQQRQGEVAVVARQRQRECPDRSTLDPPAVVGVLA